MIVINADWTRGDAVPGSRPSPPREPMRMSKVSSLLPSKGKTCPRSRFASCKAPNSRAAWARRGSLPSSPRSPAPYLRQPGSACGKMPVDTKAPWLGGPSKPFNGAVSIAAGLDRCDPLLQALQKLEGDLASGVFHRLPRYVSCLNNGPTAQSSSNCHSPKYFRAIWIPSSYIFWKFSRY